MKIAIGFDRPAAGLRPSIVGELVAQGHDVVEFDGSAAGSAEAYRQSVLAIAELIRSGRAERAILVSSSALRASFVANKIDDIHAGVCVDTYNTQRGGENGMNLACLGIALTSFEAVEIVRAFVDARVRVPAGGVSARS